MNDSTGKFAFLKTLVRGKRLLWLIAGVLVFFGLALIILSLFSGGETEFEARAIPVEVEPASPYLFADIIEAIGTALANESVTLTAKVSDKVKDVHFADGAFAKEGEILVTLNNAEVLANVSAALASYTEARLNYDRFKELHESGNVSKAALDTATRTLDEARAQLEAARARAGDYVITAPFDGVLGLRQVSPGALVSPGAEITTLDDIGIIKVDFAVPEKFLSALAEGQEILTHAAAWPGREFRGVVKTIDTRVDPVTRMVTVRAEIPNPDALLRPGMLLTVDLYSDVREAVSVPESAIVPVGERHYVFRIGPDDTASRVAIEIGGRYRSRVEVTSGLGAGDLVVYSGTVNLQDGLKTRILNERAPPALPQELAEFLSPAAEDSEQASQ